MIEERGRHFWSFVAARQRAYWAREAGGPPPYSDDPALARYHFCNVYREADRGTRWFQAHRPPRQRSLEGYADVLWAAVAYRLVNRIATFEAYGRIPARGERVAWVEFLVRRNALGEQVFTGRHMNRGVACYAMTLEALDPRCREYAEQLAETSTLAEACDRLRQLPSVGPFFAWQIVCDLVESGVVPSDDDWALLGPGARAGAALVRVDLPPLDVARWLRDAQIELLDGAVLKPPPEAPGPFSLKNVEHALCEYARYVRASDESITAKGLEVKPWAKR
jgi:hypothetical protein